MGELGQAHADISAIHRDITAPRYRDAWSATSRRLAAEWSTVFPAGESLAVSRASGYRLTVRKENRGPAELRRGRVLLFRRRDFESR